MQNRQADDERYFLYSLSISFGFLCFLSALIACVKLVVPFSGVGVCVCWPAENYT